MFFRLKMLRQMAQINDSSQQQIEQLRREGQERSEVCGDLLVRAGYLNKGLAFVQQNRVLNNSQFS